jgi:putative transposase
MDFVHDTLAGGEKIRVLTVIDGFTREALAVEARRSFRGEDVALVLQRLGLRGGLPLVIPCDQGTEFTSMAMDHWAYWNKVQIDFSRPGKPGDNAVNEAFNGNLRRECLSQHYFFDLPEARTILENWRNEYNNDRPHGSLGQISPSQFGAERRSIKTRSDSKAGGAFGLRTGS